MEFSITFDTVKSEWSIVYIEMIHVIISKKKIVHVFLSLKIIFVLAISADSDEMAHNVAFRLGLLCHRRLSKDLMVPQISGLMNHLVSLRTVFSIDLMV